MCDTASLLLAAVAIVVAIGGGFRARLGGLRLGVTSPWGPLVAAMVIAILRHVRVPRPAIHDEIGRRIGSSRSEASRSAWGALLTTRPVILFIAYFAVVTLGFAQAPAVRYSDNEFVNLQGRFDTAWYLSIAINGYEYHANAPGDQQNIVFFPAMPMAMRAAGRLLGGTVPAYLWGGTFIALGAFFWAAVYVYRLARDLLGADDPARAAVLFVATYPFAFFYSAVYSESLFLLGVTAAFFHTRRGQYTRAAAWGLLVGLTRPNGSFVALPLALLVLERWVPPVLQWGGAGTKEPSRSSDDGRTRNAVGGLLAASMPVIGLALYSAYLWRLTGDPLAWMKAQAAWGRSYTGVFAVFAKYASYLAEPNGIYNTTAVLPFDLLNGMGLLFVLALAVPVWRRFGLPYAVFVLLNMLPPLAAGGFLSMGRFSAVMFPVFLWLGAEVRESNRAAWFAQFMALQAFCAALFYTGRRLF